MTANQIVMVAKGEIGYLEKESEAQLDDKTANAGHNNYTKYGKWFGWNGVAWCHIFVSWAAEKAGCASVMPRTAGCYAGRDWFRARDQFIRRGEKAPQAGDIVYFSTEKYPDGGGHVGIVTAFDGKYISTVEGNTTAAVGVITNGGGVAAKRYAVTYNKIYGYGRPNYEEGDDVTENRQIQIDGKLYGCDCIEKDGQNFVKLRSLAQAGFTVGYDAERKLPGLTAPQCRAVVPELSVDTAAAVAKLIEVCDLEEQTIQYLLRYKYGEELVEKLAKKLE